MRRAVRTALGLSLAKADCKPWASGGGYDNRGSGRKSVGPVTPTLRARLLASFPRVAEITTYSQDQQFKEPIT